ncbi:MAG TPA: PhzF family phenazine biosynthesis protein [Jatrophihabitans sp.]|jgi:PhzF family phenazine biosynthesis protein|nr:PhzF family phenazine biosynthesis protein [Jatrophihabitans sp.]
MRVFVVDAFTDVAFRGNPAGVVLLDATVDDAWMQQVAAELRHSETAFVARRDDGAHDLRWFTPAVEVSLCGHATLATTHVLVTTGHAGPFVFHTLSGALRTERDEDGLISMDFPAQPTHPVEEPAGLLGALGVPAKEISGNGIDVLVEVADAATVRNLAPDIAALREVDCRGVIVTAGADADADHDFVSRFFAPRVGVDEDPVTGSAHCALGPYWTARLGQRSLAGVQLSPRGGRVGVDVRGDRALLRGRATTVLAGTLDA